MEMDTRRLEDICLDILEVYNGIGAPGTWTDPVERPGKMIHVVKSNIETADNFPLGPLGIRDQSVN